MLLRLRVQLPDRPGSLAQVAKTLGAGGADIVQITVLERMGGRAVDDVTVRWPAATSTDRLTAGLAAVPGVGVEGIWRTTSVPGCGGGDAELIGRIAVNPQDGLSTLVDAVPSLIGADWAAALISPEDWADQTVLLDEFADRRFAAPRARDSVSVPPGREPAQSLYASWRTPSPPPNLRLAPLRPRAFDALGGLRCAAVPFGRAGLVLVAARGGVDSGAPRFHTSEVDRLAFLVRAATAVLLERLDHAVTHRPLAAAAPH
jgi:hypothetical protein